jgi:ketosteroid isomerase-like protein
MKRMFLIALMIVVVAASLVAANNRGQKGAKGKAQGNKAGLEQTVNRYFDAIKAVNIQKIRAYYTADYTFTGVDGKIVGMEERLKQMSAGGTTVLDYSDTNIRTYGSTGVVTGVVTTKNNSSGATAKNRFIQAWTWQGGRWLLAASQATIISQ